MAKAKGKQGKTKEGFNPQDDAVRDGEHINFDALQASEEAARQGGAPFASPILPQPSALGNPYLSEEDQGMEMKAVIVGPPAYGSPDPVTSAGKLLPLDQHPLNVAALPAGHPAAIDKDYGKGAVTSLVAGRPERTDLERDLSGDQDMRDAERSGNYESLNKDKLTRLAEERGITVEKGAKKDEIVVALMDDDEERGVEYESEDNGQTSDDDTANSN